MTTQELQQLANNHANGIKGAKKTERICMQYGYQAGSLKMLQLVLNALDAAPIYTHYDLDDALKPFKQLLP